MKQRILLVTRDAPLKEAFEKACESRKILFESFESAQAAREKWFQEDSELIGVVGDGAIMTPQERYQLLQFHCEPSAPKLIALDPTQVPDPRAPIETVTRLRFPLAQEFIEGVKGVQGATLIFLADPTLYLTGQLQVSLKAAGLKPITMESTVGLAGLLEQTQGGSPTEEGIWSKLNMMGGKQDDDGPPPSTPSAIILWKGDAFDAQAVHQRLIQQIPNVRIFLVSSSSPVHSAERALAKMRPAFLPRDMAEQAIDIFSGKQAADPTSLGRALIVDNFKPALIQLSASLMQEGYEVSACMEAEEALEMVQSDRMHIAVVGAALAYAQHTGVELAQKMRELDPDLRIILMVDRYPLQTALQGVSQVVEVGLDDCLLKPVEPSRLRFSISRALERRRLLLENARLLDELKVANEELEQLTGFQQKFFAMVAHDVKNPLTAIRGYSELLSWKVKDKDLLKCVTHIQSSTRTLEGLISDLVDLAAIESGKLRVSLEECDLLQVVEEVRSRIQVAADKRSQQFHVQVPPSLDTIQGDPLRLGQVIQNLCTNAIQYTPEKGNIYLKVQPANGVITVSVRDTGIGISKEDLPRVFQRFFQAENAQKMRRAGFGLGLKISQEIVKAHGGGMGVDSELGKGSVFYFTLPQGKGGQAQAAAAQPAAVGQTPPAAPQVPSMAPAQTPPPGQPNPQQ